MGGLGAGDKKRTLLGGFGQRVKGSKKKGFNEVEVISKKKLLGDFYAKKRMGKKKTRQTPAVIFPSPPKGRFANSEGGEWGNFSLNAFFSYFTQNNAQAVGEAIFFFVPIVLFLF